MRYFIIKFCIVSIFMPLAVADAVDYTISFEKTGNYGYKCYAKNTEGKVLATFSFVPCYTGYCYITSKVEKGLQNQGLGPASRLECIKKLRDAEGNPNFGILSYVFVANYPSIRNNKNTGMIALGLGCESENVNVYFVDSEETKRKISTKYYKDVALFPGCEKKIKDNITSAYNTGNTFGGIAPKAVAESKKLTGGVVSYYDLIASTLLSDFGIKIKQENQEQKIAQGLNKLDAKKTPSNLKIEKKEGEKELSETDKLIQEQLSDQATVFILNGDLESLNEIHKNNGKKFINTWNKEGLTLLHVASRAGKMKIVKWLVENGANVKAGTKANRWETPANMASNAFHPDIAMYLNEH